MVDIANVPDSPSSVEAALISRRQVSSIRKAAKTKATAQIVAAFARKSSLQSIGVRRPIYIASLEAHIDRLHMQLMGLGADFFPVPLKDLNALKGLNTKTCKGMVSGLQHDIWQAHERLLELQRTNEELEAVVYAPCDE
ncbi:hypothetical protein B0H11DRAFT_2230405 [Mycena galericulata]|nr:hypothetical protein B0H11DRAFT_2230405 [Mycena galericulata]